MRISQVAAVGVAAIVALSYVAYADPPDGGLNSQSQTHETRARLADEIRPDTSQARSADIVPTAVMGTPTPDANTDTTLADSTPETHPLSQTVLPVSAADPDPMSGLPVGGQKNANRDFEEIPGQQELSATGYPVDAEVGQQEAQGLSPVEAASVGPDPTPGLAVGLHMDLTWDADPKRREQALTASHDILHAEVARHSLLWHLVEPTPGNRDWSVVDAVVAGSLDAGMDVLFDVRGSPPWASGADPALPDAYLYTPVDSARQEKWIEDWTEFVSEAATRYRGRVKYWSLWGEPNQHFTFKPLPNLDLYSRLYSAGYVAIKNQDPAALVSPGAVTALEAEFPGDIDGLTFLSGLLESGVALDAIAVHPYSSHAPDVHKPWENNFDDIGRVPALLAEYDLTVPVWVTEWGWSSSEVGEDLQAAYLRRSLELLTTDYRFVTLACVFLDADRPGLFDYGLLRADFTPKPAAYVFADFVAR